jgi:hypothetical protein
MEWDMTKTFVYQEGVVQGREEARQILREKGRQEGFATLAERLLEAGWPVPEIIEVTGLTERQIHKIAAATLTLPEILRKGVAVLRKELGPAGMIRFLQHFEAGVGDYVRERHHFIDGTTLDDIRAAAGEQKKDG